MARRRSKHYPTDLSNKEWNILKKEIPRQEGPGRPATIRKRDIVDAIFYVDRTGCQWRMLPRDFPKKGIVYYYFRKWTREGTWKKINDTLRGLVRTKNGKKIKPSAAVIDTQSVKTTEAGGERGYDAGKKTKGRKRHLVVDTLGMVLQVMVHSAAIQDRDGARVLLSRLHHQFGSIKRIWAEGIYAGELVDWVKKKLHIILDIVRKDPEQKGFKVLPKRWIVERTFGWFGRYRRLSKDYEHDTSSSEVMIYVASIRLMLGRLAPSG